MSTPRGTGLVIAIAGLCLAPPLTGQTPAAPLRIGSGLAAATPLADLLLASAQRVPGGLCLRGRLCAVAVTAKNTSSVGSPTVTVTTVGGRPEDESDRIGASVPSRGARVFRVNVFVPADYPADTLERTFEVRLPNGRPYEDKTSAGNRGTETWGSSFMIRVLLGAGRPETSIHPMYQMDFAAAGPISVGATRDYATRIALDPDGPLLSRVGVPERALSPGQWYTLDISVVSPDDRNAANNRGRWVFLLGAGGGVAEMRRLP